MRLTQEEEVQMMKIYVLLETVHPRRIVIREASFLESVSQIREVQLLPYQWNMKETEGDLYTRPRKRVTHALIS